ncbi:MAG: pantetheine-phosphate adenylyltransferase [Sphaerochaetaceae bacterium]
MMNNRIAMFPGTFDPPTKGHLNIIFRTAQLYDRLYVVVADNIRKKCLFTAEERVGMLKQLLEGNSNIEVVSYQGLVVEFAKKNNIGVLVRGVRALADFNYEFELAMTNKELCPELEIIFLPTDSHYFLLRSSSIKEIASFGGDVSNMVPELVLNEIKKKLAK